jgi:hypothetical protein
VTDLNVVIRQAAGDSLSRWGRDVHAEVDDLVQDLWLWYYQTPSVSGKLEASAGAEFSQEQVDKYARRIFAGYAGQLMAKQALEADLFEGKPLYSVGSVRAALRGDSDNKSLLRVLPSALDDLGRQNSGQREAIRLRYADGVVPETHSAAEKVLGRAVASLTAHINVEYISGDTSGRFQRNAAVTADARRSSGGYSDPTAEMALGLIAKGDQVIQLTDKDGNVNGTTTYREEFLADGLPASKNYHRGGSDRDTIFDPEFSDIERAALYKAAVCPELFPDEKPMLVDNWAREDLEAYCGGEYTPGYRKFSVVR